MWRIWIDHADGARTEWKCDRLELAQVMFRKLVSNMQYTGNYSGKVMMSYEPDEPERPKNVDFS